jgi:betaine-aldehyde dehydrogenase
MMNSLPSPFNNGSYYEPTVMKVNAVGMDIWRDEVFGPVVVAVSFRTEDEAIRLANDSPYGLAGNMAMIQYCLSVYDVY